MAGVRRRLRDLKGIAFWVVIFVMARSRLYADIPTRTAPMRNGDHLRQWRLREDNRALQLVSLEDSAAPIQ